MKKIKQAEERAKRKKNQKQEDDSVTIDMPEVKDIPGQENVKPPRMREMMDTTISSADEEGEGILDDLNKEIDNDIITDKMSNVSNQEKNLLKKTGRPVDEEEKDRQKLALDNSDGDDFLNEDSDPENLGEDLDMPDEDKNDEPGEEDEENTVYSRPD